MTELVYARVQSHLERLKLPQMATCLDGIAQQAVKDSYTYVDFLDRLLEAEHQETEPDAALPQRGYGFYGPQDVDRRAVARGLGPFFNEDPRHDAGAFDGYDEDWPGELP